MDVDLMGSARTGLQVGRMFAQAITVLLKPLAIITQMFYRKEMGERYVQQWHILVGAGFICLATYASANGTIYESRVVQDTFGQLRSTEVPASRTHPLAYWIGGAWLVVFFLACTEHRLRIRGRYKRGQRWHSMCLGVPRLPILTELVQAICTGGLVYASYHFRMEPIAALLFSSLVAGASIDEVTKRMFWNQVLDTIDAQIEAEQIGKAIQQRLSPAQAEGVAARVPAALTGRSRKEIAAALAAAGGGCKQGSA